METFDLVARADSVAITRDMEAVAQKHTDAEVEKIMLKNAIARENQKTRLLRR